MTKRRKRWLIGLSALALAATLATPAVHWRLIGWARRELMCQGRPASYWREVVEESEVSYFTDGNVELLPVTFYRPLSAADKARIWVAKATGWEALGCVYYDLGLQPQPAAVPLLIVLLDDESSYVRCFAAQMLGTIGAPATPALPSLRRNLSDERGDVAVTRAAVLAASDAIRRITTVAGIEDPTGKGQ